MWLPLQEERYWSTQDSPPPEKGHPQKRGSAPPRRPHHRPPRLAWLYTSMTMAPAVESRVKTSLELRTSEPEAGQVLGMFWAELQKSHSFLPCGLGCSVLGRDAGDQDGQPHVALQGLRSQTTWHGQKEGST